MQRRSVRIIDKVVMAGLFPPCLLASLALLAGCTPQPPPAATPAEPVPAGIEAAGLDSPDSGGKQIPLGETWDVLYVQGAKSGYLRTSVKKIEEGGRSLLEFEGEQRFEVQRFGDASAPGIVIKSIETPAGEVMRFESRMEQGPTPMLAAGRVEKGTMTIETNSTGQATTSTIPWTADIGGFFATEFSLLLKPMKPGETRAFKQLTSALNEVGVCKLTAKVVEPTKLLDETKELLHIDAVIQLASGSELRSVIWCDADGTTLKTHMDAMSMEIFRTTKEIALAKSKTVLDLGASTSVPLTTPLAGVHAARKQRYKVTLAPGAAEADNDPARIFVNGPTQIVKPLAAGEAEIEVRSIRPGPPDTSPVPADAAPGEADIKSNNFIQSDDPEIVRMANEAAGKEKEPWKIALALEKYVHDGMKLVNFSQTFATAADVAKSREGDCTEHAVLLAALARAKGIPARVAIGLVYVEGRQFFGFHMWDELYLGGRWIPMDATLGNGGVGAGHLKLGQSNLAGGEGYSSFLPVAKVMGRLKIEPLPGE